jgi:hypothetical protein
MNEQWHKDHVLADGASMERRIEWHLEHHAACGCEEIPAPVQEAIRERQIQHTQAN